MSDTPVKGSQFAGAAALFRKQESDILKKEQQAQPRHGVPAT